MIMTTDLDIPRLRLKLIELYSMYVENPENQMVKEALQLINSGYRNADDLISPRMAQAVNCALYVGLDLEKSPSVEEIKKLIADLKVEHEQSKS